MDLGVFVIFTNFICKYFLQIFHFCGIFDRARVAFRSTLAREKTTRSEVIRGI